MACTYCPGSIPDVDPKIVNLSFVYGKSRMQGGAPLVLEIRMHGSSAAATLHWAELVAKGNRPATVAFPKNTADVLRCAQELGERWSDWANRYLVSCVIWPTVEYTAQEL